MSLDESRRDFTRDWEEDSDDCLDYRPPNCRACPSSKREAPAS